MPMNRLSVLFDRIPRHSKSTSNLVEARGPQSLSVPAPSWGSKSKDRPSIMLEYKFDQLPPPAPNHAPPPPPMVRAVSPQRANTTPVMHPPDELFLSMIRRRSASARLEEQRIQHEHNQYHAYYDWQESTPTPVAVACALPPQYFDMPPKYESPQQTKAHRPIRTRATIERLRDPELFLEDSLKLQIDQTIAEFGGFRLTEATPVPTPTTDDALVSPINEIDNIYLERRRQRRQRRQEQQGPSPNT